ncbi:pre-rRNA processing protein [Cichlidogyrus casuarinus]|uniref:Pre-rRNA processing protein n=1 Tax=Cichlidogyrus casuarinus TaxID=1844966 RepID=A0ABD2PTW2_9PLAT
MKTKHASAGLKLSKKRKRKDDDSVSSGSDSDEKSTTLEIEEDPYEKETAREKHIRLTRKALQEAKDALASDEDEEFLSNRLHEEILTQREKIMRHISDKVKIPEISKFRELTGHGKSPTCLCISDNGEHLYTAGKDATLIKWSLATLDKQIVRKGGNQKKPAKIGHTGPILAISVSSDERYVASGGADKLVIVWNAVDLSVFAKLSRHQSPVTAVSFRCNSHMLFTGDKSGRVCAWNMPLTDLIQDQGARTHIEVLGVVGLKGERCVTCTGYGGPGVTVWKVPEEICVQYAPKSGHEESMECIYAVMDDLFISGSVSNKLYVWNTSRGSPVQVLCNAHAALDSEDLDSWRTSHLLGARKPLVWITCITGLRGTDLIATGASTGEVLFWKISQPSKVAALGQTLSKEQRLQMVDSSVTGTKLAPLPNSRIQFAGFVNSLVFSPDGKFLCVAVGQELRLGKWEAARRKSVKNSVHIVPLNLDIKLNSNPLLANRDLFDVQEE